MIEAFYSGSASLKAHQNSMDVISNNMSNINTNGFKAKKQQFSSLLSISEVRPETENSQNLLAGSGSKISSATTDMSGGNLEQTQKLTDYYITGNGLFAVRDDNGNTFYTRDGSFHVKDTQDGEVLATNSGMTVLDAQGNPATANSLPGVYTFTNEQGLKSDGGNLFEVSNTSGAATPSGVTPGQGMLEGSNVDLADQMAGLIYTQRGYQLSSNVVSTANQVETMINELKQG